MRGLTDHEQPFEAGRGPFRLAEEPYPDHVEGQLKLFGNRKRDAALAAVNTRDGETDAEELQPA